MGFKGTDISERLDCMCIKNISWLKYFDIYLEG